MILKESIDFEACIPSPFAHLFAIQHIVAAFKM
jgi:hypothetical protein